MSSQARTDKVATAAFLTLLGLAVAVLFGLCLRVATVEWFSSDDFATLAELRQTPWSWLDTYLPLESRTRWFYRPLGVYTWYAANLKAFGLDATPWFAQAVSLHFATGIAALIVARRMGFSLPIAALAAALCVSRQAGVERIYYGAVFSYVATVFLTTLALWLWIDAARDGGGRRRAGACLAFAASLLCHESAVVWVAILPLAGVATRSWRATAGGLARTLRDELRNAAPLFAIAALWLVVRFFVIADSDLATPYEPRFSANLLANYGRYLVLVSGPPGLLALAAAAALAIAALATRRDTLAGEGRWLVVTQLFCLAWLSLSVLPFLAQPVANTRYTLLIEIPACLLLASHLEIAWRRWGAAHAAPLLVALAVLALAAMPFQQVAARASAPERPRPQQFVSLIESALPELGERGRVVVLYGAAGLADVEAGRAFAELHYGRTVALRALFPEQQLRLVLHDLELPPGRALFGPHRLYLTLHPGLRFERARSSTLHALFERGGRSNDAAVRAAAERALGRPAPP